MKKKEVIIFGCGNIFVGDDGFGPAVIRALERTYTLPQEVLAMDVGTSIRDYLFDYLLDKKQRPKKIIIIDSVNIKDRQPGEVFTLDLHEIPENKQHDYSLHQYPTINMLKELQQHTEIGITVIAAQVSSNEHEIGTSLSREVQAAIPKACILLQKHLNY